MTSLFSWGLGFAAFTLAIVAFIKTSRRPLVLRLLVAASVVSGAIAIQGTVASICVAPTFDSADLAQVVALSRGYRLYPEPAAGVMSSWTDGPVAGVAFLPASFASSPTTQILIAAGIEAMLLFSSIAWLHWRLAGPRHRGFALLTMLVLLWCVLDDRGMSRIAFAQSATGPMLSLMLATVVMLTYRTTTKNLALAAFCTALACWCKTGAAFWFFVPSVFLLASGGRRTAAKFLLLFGCAWVLVLGAILLRFNVRGMWYYMVTLPLAQPWYALPGQGRMSALLEPFIRLLESTITVLGLFIAAVLLRRFLAPAPLRGESRLVAWSRRPWIMLPLSALILLPGCVFEYLKVEHGAASMGPVSLFLAIGASTALILSYRRLPSDPREQTHASSIGAIFAAPEEAGNLGCEVYTALRNAARPIIVAGLCIFSMARCIPIAFTPGVLSNLQRTIVRTYVNHHEIVFAYLQKHRGQGYFPGDTLSTLLASGRLYHSEDGIRLRYLAQQDRQRFNLKQIKDYLPAQARFVAFSPSDQTQDAIKLFPAARKRISIPELPGFVLYTDQ